MSGAVGTAEARNPWLTAAAWRALFRDRPIIPLSAAPGLLVVLFDARPGQREPADWVGVIFRAAVPLAILAGCQTLAMLTGGIDLSVGAVASMAGLRRRDAGRRPWACRSRSSSRSSRRRWSAW